LLDGVRIVRDRRLYAPRRLVAALRAQGTPGSLLVFWTLLPLAVFTLSRSRLPLYVLPLYAPIALAIARGLASTNGVTRRREMRLALISIAILIGLKGAMAYRPSRKDATRVYHEAVQAAGRDARFALYREPKFYGFEFYVGDELERVTPAGTEPWADRRLDEALASREPGRPYAIVTMPPFADELERVLAKREIPFARQPLTGREVFVISPTARIE
jgi:4-amino-4-deoxy-L-arabinose transferase